MKRFFAMAIVVAAVLTSCVKNETFAPANEIHFKNFALSNKALVSAGAFDTNLTFGVFAHNGTDFSYIPNKEVEYKTSYWGFNPAIMWPTNNGTPIALDFFAYYPYNDNSGTEQVACDLAKGISITGANLGTTIGDQTDYLVAPVVPDQTVQASAVGVAFEHISSLLLFSAQDITQINELKNKVTVNSITIKNVSTSGDYANTAAGDVAGTWTAGAAGDLPKITLDASVATTAAELTTTTSNPVLVIPTTLTAATQTVDIVYSIAAYNYGGEDFPAQNNITASFDLKAGTIVAWEQGKKYVYTIKFNLTEELEIKFAPTVVDWTEGGAADLTVDKML